MRAAPGPGSGQGRWRRRDTARRHVAGRNRRESPGQGQPALRSPARRRAVTTRTVRAGAARPDRPEVTSHRSPARCRAVRRTVDRTGTIPCSPVASSHRFPVRRWRNLIARRYAAGAVPPTVTRPIPSRRHDDCQDPQPSKSCRLIVIYISLSISRPSLALPTTAPKSPFLISGDHRLAILEVKRKVSDGDTSQIESDRFFL